jgi:hypothetical protein
MSTSHRIFGTWDSLVPGKDYISIMETARGANNVLFFALLAVIYFFVEVREPEGAIC